MKVAAPLLAFLAVSASSVAAEADKASSTFQYESDVARLRSIVVNSLYGSKDIFLRELLSNANDALEKLRLTGLTDPTVVVGSGELNVTISAISGSGGDEAEPGKLVLRDTGIGMRSDELKINLGTIAKSGTSDFLSRAEASSAPLASDNLIGQFGLGFYSSFLIADVVEVASLPPPTEADPNPKQHVFRSNAAGSSFEVYEDPRGNTLGERGTEITLFLREGEDEWLKEQRLRELVEKHSAFASAFPIYLETRVKTTRPVTSLEHEPVTPADADEVTVSDDDEDAAEPETEEIETIAFEQLNKHEPLWMREPKSVSEEEYNGLYRALSKDSVDPLAWSHFKGETGAGIGFRSLIYVPAELPVDFWQRATEGVGRNVRMLVKRVFITDDLGDGFLPKWLSFLRIVVDADDLPLTVSRNTLSSSKFISQLSRTLVKRSLDLFAKLAANEPEKYAKLYKLVGHAFKAGIADRSPEKAKLAGLLRFKSNHDNSTSLDDYVSRRKQGQKQIFFLAGVGQPAADLLKSPFVEKLDARGYEVLLLNEPLDEIVLSHLRSHKSLDFQDVSKKGFRFGDEDLDKEEDRAMQAQMKEDFAPLASWIKQAFGNIISDVVVSTRLVSSPTAIVAESHGLSANMMRLMAAQASAAGEDDPMLAFAKSQKKVLEINPHSPLIQGLLEEVAEADEDETKSQELHDTIETLLDVTLVRSGFPVEDMNSFFGRVEGLLRRSVGVPTKAKTYQPPVKPAPDVDTDPVESPTMPDYGNVDGADEAEVERLLREVKDFSSAGANEADDLNFHEFDREQLRRKVEDIRHSEL